MRDVDELYVTLRQSPFRARQTLNDKDRRYLTTRGLDAILVHAAAFIEKRLAPREPRNDGKQTPWRGHPVFVAQHATATCCRGCLAQWHRIERGRELTEAEQGYIVRVLGRWLEPYTQTGPSRAGP
jgi:hypothetical protein